MINKKTRSGRTLSLCVYYFAKYTKAAKQHSCYECEHPIQLGEVYVESRHVSNAPYKTVRRRHIECLEWCQVLNTFLKENAEVSIGTAIRIFGEIDVLESAPLSVQHRFRQKKPNEYRLSKTHYLCEV